MYDMVSIFRKKNYFKKYFLSWFLPLISFLIYYRYDKFYLLVIFIYSFLLGIFYFKINYVQISKDYFFYGKKKIRMSEIENVYRINQKAWVFYIFETTSTNFFNKYLIAEANIIGLKTILNWKGTAKKTELFIDLLRENTNIPHDRIEKLF